MIIFEKLFIFLSGRVNLMIYAANIIFLLLAVCFLPIAFETNDDAMMMLLASGQYTGTPEAFLVFINVIYGYIVSKLYFILPGFAWYTLLFLWLQFVSLNILLKSIIIKNNPIYIKLLFLALLYTIGLNSIVSFQFTTTAALTALSGLVAINGNKKTRYLGCLLFMIASLIRFEAAFLVLLVFSPIFYVDAIQFFKYTIWRKKKRKSSSKILALVISICLAFAMQWLNNFITSNHKIYASYYQYNAIRGKIHDNPLAKNIIHELPAGINEKDFKIFNQFIIDKNIFSMEKLTQIESEIKILHHNNFTLTGIKNLSDSYLKYFICLVFLTLAFIQLNNSKVKKYRIALSLLIFFILSVAISIGGIFKYRVFITAILPLLFVIGENYEGQIKQIPKLNLLVLVIVLPLLGTFLKFPFLLILVLIMLLVIMITKFRLEKINYVLFAYTLVLLLFIFENMEVNNIINKSKRIEFSQQLKLMNDAIGLKNKSIFVLPSRLRVEAIDPLETKSLQPINNIIFSGWLTGHPDKSHAITDFNSLLQNSYFMIDHNDTSVVSDIQDIVKTHYNKKFNTKIVLNNNDCRIIEFELIE